MKACINVVQHHVAVKPRTPKDQNNKWLPQGLLKLLAPVALGKKSHVIFRLTWIWPPTLRCQLLQRTGLDPLIRKCSGIQSAILGILGWNYCGKYLDWSCGRSHRILVGHLVGASCLRDQVPSGSAQWIHSPLNFPNRAQWGDSYLLVEEISPRVSKVILGVWSISKVVGFGTRALGSGCPNGFLSLH